MTALILDWSDAREPAAVGGKAAALSDLARAGFHVPRFLAILPAAFRPDGLQTNIASELAERMNALGPGPFAVRSSGREEDGAAHSHAGQFLSVLQVPGSEVATAAAQVWRSGEAESVRAYRTSRGIDPSGGAPAVIVQQMITARAAGVAFSADPVSGRRDRIVISAVAGLADRLVSGDVDGFDYVVDRAVGKVIAAPPDGVLTGADIASLADLVRRVEDARGAPQDIEWAFEGEKLFLLQARPITTALRAAPIADPAVSLFDNSNIVESYPGIVSPLTFSFAQYVYARVYRTFVALLGVDDATIRAHGSLFENMLARIDGRVYYNLVNWYRALALLPGFAITRGHMETMMGVGEPLPADIFGSLGPRPARGFDHVRDVARLARVGLGLAREAVRMRRTVRAFYARLDAALATDASRIDAMPLTALAAEYRRLESEKLLDRWDAPLINDFLCMIAFGASRKLMERWGGSAGIEIHNAVMIGQGDIISAEPAQRIARMGALAARDARIVAALAAGDRTALSSEPELAREFDDYIAKFGERCTEELKLESITLADDPTALLRAVAGAAEKSRPSQPARRIARDAIFPGRPLRNIVARVALALAKARVRDRENLRFERTRVFGRARRLFMAMGRQLHARDVIDDPRDVLLLTVDEVLGAIEGFATTVDLKALAAVRRAELAAGAKRPDPPERIRVDGAFVCRAPAAAPAADTGRGGAETVRSGTGCSAGIVRARARVVRDPRTEAVAPGEVIVARNTDPGWIALFANASAIVVERGSLLSHSAIVARELGIPCVVGLRRATEWIRSGDEIEVDGSAGTVRLVDG